MENQNRNTDISGRTPDSNPSTSLSNGRLWGGLIVLLVGGLLLADKTGAAFPDWLISFKTFLIGLGLFLGFRHSFCGFFWLIPIVVGVIFLLGDIYPWYDLRRFTFPILVIGFGLFLVLQALKRKPEGRSFDPMVRAEDSSDDILDSVVIFGGAKKNVISKSFRGGEAVTVFGGTDINLMQAELAGPVVLELTQIFGGTKLLVPAHWQVQSREMVAILGGVDDKRPVVARTENDPPILILKGTCLFGGIDIKSY